MDGVRRGRYTMLFVLDACAVPVALSPTRRTLIQACFIAIIMRSASGRRMIQFSKKFSQNDEDRSGYF